LLDRITMYPDRMRTTVDLDDDTAKAIDKLRRRRGIGLSEAVNDLVRQGLLHQPMDRPPFTQATRDAGLRIDVTNVAEALDLLEGPTAR
jgi:hypothetical protein